MLCCEPVRLLRLGYDLQDGFSQRRGRRSEGHETWGVQRLTRDAQYNCESSGQSAKGAAWRLCGLSQQGLTPSCDSAAENLKRVGIMRRYRAIIANPETETALEVTVRAKSLTMACKQLEKEYGDSAVYSLHREDDALQLAGDSSTRNRYQEAV